MLYDLKIILEKSSKPVAFNWFLSEINTIRTVGHSAKDAGKINLIMYLNFKDNIQRKQNFLIWWS